MGNEKLCPLLMASEEVHVECAGFRCAWYVPPMNPRQEGRCAVQCLGALPDLAMKVGRL